MQFSNCLLMTYIISFTSCCLILLVLPINSQKIEQQSVHLWPVPKHVVEQPGNSRIPVWSEELLIDWQVSIAAVLGRQEKQLIDRVLARFQDKFSLHKTPQVDEHKTQLASSGGSIILFSVKIKSKLHHEQLEACSARLPHDVHMKRSHTFPFGDNEAYTLETWQDTIMNNDRSTQTHYIVHVEAGSAWGLIRSLQTLEQFLVSNAPGQLELIGVPFELHDAPAYPHRGVLIDVARHYYSPQQLASIIDFLSVYKMNVLHLHLSDDQSFMLDIPSLPGLAKPLNVNGGPVYNSTIISQLIDHAAMHGIRIIPEIGMPGHAAAWFTHSTDNSQTHHMLTDNNKNGGVVAYCPHYACKEEGWSIPLNPYSKHTFSVIERVLHHIDRLFPDPFWHLGGDETDDGLAKKCWQEDASIVQSPSEILTFFQAKLQQLLRAKYAHRVSILWEEAWGGKDTPFSSYKGFNVVNFWKNWEHHRAKEFNNLNQTTQAVIQSAGWYPFDCLSARHCYHSRLVDQLPPQANTLGGEISLWEFSMRELQTLNQFPKVAAVAGRLWNTPDQSQTAPASISSLENVCPRMALLPHSMYPPLWCNFDSHLDKPSYLKQRSVKQKWKDLGKQVCQAIDPTQFVCSSTKCSL
mmetsp:Transcript_20712/g.30789  ORF Transcript_20712/g.30789 Transcript_20712/m.30789 type:complete len:634 (-) Transcript_20712:31-1932(-)